MKNGFYNIWQRSLNKQLSALLSLMLVFSPSLLMADEDLDLEGYIQSIGTDHIVVNSIIFTVGSNTEIEDEDGDPITLADLQQGDFVEVEANFQSGSGYHAVEIEVDDAEDVVGEDIDLEGFIELLGPDYLVVNTVVFFVDSNTVIEDGNSNPILFNELHSGDFVEIEGELQADTTYLAVEIELENQNEEIEVEGFITAIDSNSLVVGAIQFFVDGNTEIEDDDSDSTITFADLQVGDYVEVEARLLGDGSYLAIDIELEDEDEDIEFDGSVSEIQSDRFTANAIVVIVDANTVVRDRDGNLIDLSGLSLQDPVNVEGIVTNNNSVLGTVVAVRNPLTGIDEGSAAPENFVLLQNYPNPFNPETQIRYQISDIKYQSGNERLLNLAIFDVMGRKIRTLVNEIQPPGSYSITWNGRDDGGRQMASGVYYYRLQAGPFNQTRKMILLR